MIPGNPISTKCTNDDDDNKKKYEGKQRTMEEGTKQRKKNVSLINEMLCSDHMEN